jgi:hypothetical protein
MLIPSENEISRAGPLLAICRSQSIHYVPIVGAVITAMFYLFSSGSWIPPMM